ncbi:MAG: hypothetical protein GC155_03650 [Alphaproteobacteria bacterium]|nr:hypothetical protein [Alphaproteobacteria bacterium]
MPRDAQDAGLAAKLVGLVERDGAGCVDLPGAEALPAPEGVCSLMIVSGQGAEAFVARVVAERLAVAAAPVQEGGFALAAVRMALALDGCLTADVSPVRIRGEDSDTALEDVMFGEAAGRLLVAAPDENESAIDHIAIELGAMGDCLMMGSVETGGKEPRVRFWRAPMSAPVIDLPLSAFKSRSHPSTRSGRGLFPRRGLFSS